MDLRAAAELVSKDIRTIQRWAAKGIDVTDPAALMSHSKAMDAKARGKAKKHVLAKMPSAAPESPAGASKPKTATEIARKSAAEVLADLQGLTATFKTVLDTAIAGGNQADISVAHAEYQKAAEGQRKYEAAVSQHDRDTGSLMPRRDLLNTAMSCAHWINLGWKQWVSSCLPHLLIFEQPREAKEYIFSTFGEHLQIAIENSQDSQCPIPPDCRQIILQAWHADRIRDKNFQHHSKYGVSWNGGETYEDTENTPTND